MRISFPARMSFIMQNMCCQVSQVLVDIPPTPQNDIDVPRTGLFHIEVNKKEGLE